MPTRIFMCTFIIHARICFLCPLRCALFVSSAGRRKAVTNALLGETCAGRADGVLLGGTSLYARQQGGRGFVPGQCQLGAEGPCCQIGVSI